MLLGAEVVISDGEVEDVNFAFYVPLLSNVRLVLNTSVCHITRGY